MKNLDKKSPFYYYVKAIKQYAVFSGRATRKEFWIFFLYNSILEFAFGHAEKTGLLVTVYSLFIITPFFAVTIRRMHDLGKSGWWALIFLLIIILDNILSLFGFPAIASSQYYPYLFIFILGMLVFMIIMALPGNKGTNKYGESTVKLKNTTVNINKSIT